MGRLILRCRNHGRVAVDGPPAGRVDHPLHAEAPAAFEEIHRSHDVHVGVEERVFDRPAHLGLGGEVNHRIRLLGAKHVGQIGAADVHDGEPRRRRHRLAVARREVVDDDDVVAGRDAAVDDVRADESRATGDENSHADRLR
jgi:hypothetical protein